MMLVTLFALLLGSLHVNGDCYMHQPRGSNNRLNEKSANRNNANRMFDSQNNNRGGYNVGDLNDDAFGGGNPYRTNGNAASNFQQQYKFLKNGVEDDEGGINMQYDMMFVAGSQKEWAWTIQHGCGNAKNMCHMVLQWTCDTEDWQANNLNTVKNSAGKVQRHGIFTTLRNGGNTNTPNTANKPGGNAQNNKNNVANNVENRYKANKNAQRGAHESEMWYLMGETRERNKGLFTADQKLNGNTMKNTRQNPGGTRRGLEVPEERDYYPHWRPSPFRDAAIITNEPEFCKKYIAPESQNIKDKWACISPNTGFPTTNQIKAVTQAACTAAAGLWDGFSWKKNAGAAGNLVTAPECIPNQFSKVNHLGNVAASVRGGKTASYMWTVPSIDTLKAYGCKIYNSGNTATEAGNVQAQYARIVTRLRYNMSSADYDPYKTDASQNQNLKAGIVSPIQQNPTVDIGVHVQGLNLAINTAQTGRTFQDRSHVMTIVSTPNVRRRLQGAKGKKILNVNIQGKRGNIVQTFPAVEYDFAPPYIEMKAGSACMHFQWTGSNTHNNGNPAGDGQAGDAGEGTGGTDRGNLISTWDMRASYPMALDKTPANGAKDLIAQSDCYDPLSGAKLNSGANGDFSCQISLVSSGFYESKTNMEQTGGNRQLNNLLNNAGASYRRGMLVCPKDTTPPGEYFMMNTRNNNHSNRSQKLKVVITA